MRIFVVVVMCVVTLSACGSTPPPSAPTQSFVVAGVIHESVPTENVPVAGARVEVQGGLDAGAFAITDSSGRFRLEVKAAGFTLLVTKDGYDPASSVIALLPRDQQPDIGLVPDARPAHSSFTGNICTIAPPFPQALTPCSGNNFPYPVEARYRLPVHRSGRAMISVKYRYIGDYYWNYLNFQLQCGGRVIAEKRVDNLWDTHPSNTGPFETTLGQACAYEIRLFDYIADRKGGDWTTYTVDIDHPK